MRNGKFWNNFEVAAKPPGRNQSRETLKHVMKASLLAVVLILSVRFHLFAMDLDWLSTEETVCSEIFL